MSICQYSTHSVYRVNKKFNLAEKVANEVVKALTRLSPQPPEGKEVFKRSLVYRGKDYMEALENMEKFFMQHGWSDGRLSVAIYAGH